MSLHEWRQRLKVMKAMSLLNQGYTIESIALDLGYASSSAFIYMFKRWMNYTLISLENTIKDAKFIPNQTVLVAQVHMAHLQQDNATEP